MYLVCFDGKVCNAGGTVVGVRESCVYFDLYLTLFTADGRSVLPKSAG